LRDEIIELEYNPEDETGKKQTKVTNSFEITANGHTENSTDQESIFSGCSSCEDASDQYAGCERTTKKY